MSVLVVGSTALDDVETSFGKRINALGGSAFYASVASQLFKKTSLIGIVGSDFPKKHITFLKKKKIDISGLEIVEGGKTFHWKGKYHKDINQRDTLDLQLNTFLDFSPKLSKKEQKNKFMFLANIDPELQLSVLNQKKEDTFVLVDTMDFWINEKLSVLKKMLKKVDAFVLNDSEAKLLTGSENIFVALNVIKKMGPKIIVIKKGEHGAVLYDGKDIFMAPAYPLSKVVDPTGAGDSFAGAFIGYIASASKITPAILRKAVLYGTVAASFTCESFSMEKLGKVTKSDLTKRYKELVKMTKLD